MVDRQLRHRGLCDEAVLEAMRVVPRHLFVPKSHRAEAYADRALPTMEGQTISQPYIVALMTQLLRVTAGLRVLEVGTGSGYQAAVLVHLGARVVTVESHATLADSARLRLAGLQLDDRVEVVVGDGTMGWPQQSPYDRIIVTAAAPQTPGALRDQLAGDGRIVIPLGDRSSQQLVVLERRGQRWTEQKQLPCRFVSLVGADGWPEL